MKLRKQTLLFVLLVLVLGITVAGAAAQGQQADEIELPRYEVTVTNLTEGQPLTPPLLATHSRLTDVFTVGQPASFGIKEIAENGNLQPLIDALHNDPLVLDVVTAGAPLVPDGTPGGEMFDDSVTLTIEARPFYRFLSFASMLVCTNDGFTGLDAVELPFHVGESITVYGNGYDAGTEINTEDFADIVPPCQGLIGVTSDDAGTGMSNPALAQGGVIEHHPGIQGGADLVPEIHGWDDPVVEVTITRVR